MSVFVKKVKHNVKRPAEIPLAPLTCVIGPSGSGKSALWNALEIQYAGGASDVGLNPWVGTPKALLDELLPPGHTALEIQAELSSGVVDSTTIKRNAKTGGAVSPAVQIAHPGLLPIRSFLEGMRGKPETVRQFLMGHMAGHVTAADLYSVKDWPALAVWLEGQYAGHLAKDVDGRETAVKAVLAQHVGTKALRLFREYAVQQGNLAKKKGEGAEATIKSIKMGLAERPTDAQIEEAKGEIAMIKHAIETAGPGDTVITLAEVEALYNDVLNVQQDVAMQEALIAGSTAYLEAHPLPAPDVLTLRQALAFVMHAHLFPVRFPVSALDGRPLSDGVGPGTYHEVQQRLDALIAEMAALNDSKTVQQTKASAEAKLGVAREKFESCRVKWEAARDKYIAQQNFIQAGGVIESRAAKLIAAQAKLGDYEAITAKWIKLDEQHAIVKAAETQAEAWASAIAKVDETSQKLLEDARSAFVGRVNLYTDKETFDLVLTDPETKVPVCRWGYVRGERLITALSGYEIGHCLAAMTAACLHDHAAKGPVLLSLPKDANVDKGAMRKLIASFRTLVEGFGVQVILFSTERPASKRVPGCLYVFLDKEGKVESVEGDEDVKVESVEGDESEKVSASEAVEQAAALPTLEQEDTTQAHEDDEGAGEIPMF